MSSSESMYGSRAALYDLIYHWKDYQTESEALRALLEREGVAPGARLLEAAMGTGQHLERLAAHYEVAGFDLNEGVLNVARARLPGASLWTADMADFAVDRPYDALICMFSAIGYLLDRESLLRAARCFRAALRPGGVLIVEPWLTPEQWSVGRPNLQTYDSPTLKLARATISDRDGDISVMDMHWLVVPEGGPIEHFVDTHRTWLCPRDVMTATFEEAGFSVRFEEPGLPRGRGLFVGRAR